MTDFVPVNEPLLCGREKEYLSECIEGGWISSEGPFVRRFEDELAHYLGRRHAIALCNGSAALEIAVSALGIGPGDEVILPTFTIISCASAIVRAGAIPIVVDCEPDTWNMDVRQVEDRITQKTKAIMVVHIYGLPVDMDPVISLSEKYGLQVIEDAAEAHGLMYNGRQCGSFGDISTFSFYPNKLITTGEGGMVVTDNDHLADHCRSLRNLCFQSKKRFVHEELGWNFRMSNIQASIGVAQLERLDESIAKKKYIAQQYNNLLSNIPGIQLPVAKTDYAENIYWVYGILLNHDIPFDAEEAMQRLAKHKIGTRPFFWPMHEQPVFKKMGLFTEVSCPVAERIARRGFYIPSGMAISDRQIERTAEAVKKVMDI